MDPAHVPYTHYGLMNFPKPKGEQKLPDKPFVLVIQISFFTQKIHTVNTRGSFPEKADREGGQPLEISVKKLGVNGFIAKQGWGSAKFTAPCVYHVSSDPFPDKENGSVTSDGVEKVIYQMYTVTPR